MNLGLRILGIIKIVINNYLDQKKIKSRLQTIFDFILKQKTSLYLGIQLPLHLLNTIHHGKIKKL